MAKIINHKLISSVQKSQMRDDIPSFRAGDTIAVSYKITEGKKTRVQTFIGIVMKIRGRNTSRTFIIRKNSNGLGVEETFMLHSPQIVKIEVQKYGKVRRAYISYMRKRSGKSARIKESTKKSN